jgi:hypothetical protein
MPWLAGKERVHSLSNTPTKEKKKKKKKTAFGNRKCVLSTLEKIDIDVSTGCT